MKIFISYNHKDKAIAQLIAAILRYNHCEVIIDSFSMSGGKSIEEFIKESINKSDTVIGIISKNSLYSAWVAKEYIDSMNKKNFVGVLIDKEIFSKDVVDQVSEELEKEIILANQQIIERTNKNRGIEDILLGKKLKSTMLLNLSNIIATINGKLNLQLEDEYFVDKLIRSLL